MLEQISDHGAGVLAATSGVSATVALTHIDAVISIIAGLVAIFAGVTAGVYHIAKTSQLREKIDDLEEDLNDHLEEEVTETSKDND